MKLAESSFACGFFQNNERDEQPIEDKPALTDTEPAWP